MLFRLLPVSFAAIRPDVNVIRIGLPLGELSRAFFPALLDKGSHMGTRCRWRRSSTAALTATHQRRGCQGTRASRRRWRRCCASWRARHAPPAATLCASTSTAKARRTCMQAPSAALRCKRWTRCVPASCVSPMHSSILLMLCGSHSAHLRDASGKSFAVQCFDIPKLTSSCLSKFEPVWEHPACLNCWKDSTCLANKWSRCESGLVGCEQHTQCLLF